MRLSSSLVQSAIGMLCLVAGSTKPSGAGGAAVRGCS
jgi:hypothetical protein